MIIITGAAGFIGSALLAHINALYPDVPVVIVDRFSESSKRKNYKGKKWISCVERDAFFGFFEENHHKISFVFHFGARTDTAEMDVELFNRLNLNYSKKMWDHCCRFKIPLIYASSAATYGDGNLGYSDDHEITTTSIPLNPYGDSKNEFDKWVLKQEDHPPFWAGLKFFNVYGPNEYHKDRMASVIFHAFKQIRSTKKMNLFRSHRPDFKDGQQSRDFIYIKDVLKVTSFLYDHSTSVKSGIYNVGTGLARSFEDLANAVFDALGIKSNIEFIDTPENIRDKYQYYTCANMDKLRNAGYKEPFYTLEEGIEDYVTNFLFEQNYL